MNFIKKNWKILLIIVFCFLYLSTCATKNNYKRRLKAEYNTTSEYKDSIDNVIKWHECRFDSLCKENEKLYITIDMMNKDIDNLNKEIGIYKDQNNKLHNKKFNVIVKEIKQEEIIQEDKHE